MSVIIKGMKLPYYAAVNGEKDTAYKCVILAHPDNSVELVIDTKFASTYDNGHNIQRYPLTEISTPHGRLIDADYLKKDRINIGGTDNDYMQITKDEAESLLNFIELDFFESVHHDGCDNIEYIANICSIWRKAKNLIAEVSE